MLSRFQSVGLGKQELRIPSNKKLFWHIDFLLDALAVDLAQVIILRNEARLEGRLAALLQTDPHTSVLAAGLGARDAPGNTHLLGVKASEGWWRRLVAMCAGI